MLLASSFFSMLRELATNSSICMQNRFRASTESLNLVRLDGVPSTFEWDDGVDAPSTSEYV